MFKASVNDAAVLLGKSVENIRKMARRKKLKSQKVAGRVYILLDDEYALKAKRLKAAGANRAPDIDAIISDMRSEIERLKKENHNLIRTVERLSALLHK